MQRTTRTLPQLTQPTQPDATTPRQPGRRTLSALMRRCATLHAERMTYWLAANDTGASPERRAAAYARFTASVQPAGALLAELARLAPDAAAHVAQLARAAEHQAHQEYCELAPAQS